MIPPLLTCAVITTMRTTRSTYNNKHKRIYLPVPFPVPFLTCAGYNNAYCTVQRAACTVQVTTMRTRRRRSHNNLLTSNGHQVSVPFTSTISTMHTVTTMSTKDRLTTTNALLYTKDTAYSYNNVYKRSSHYYERPTVHKSYCGNY